MINIPGNPNNYPANVRAPNGSDPRNSTVSDAGLQDLADRTANLHLNLGEAQASIEEVRNAGASRLSWENTLADMAARFDNDGNICLVPTHGIYMLELSARVPDGVSCVRSTADPTRVWTREPSKCNEDAGYPVIGPAYPYDGTVAGKTATTSGRINSDLVPNSYLGTWEFGVSAFGTDPDHYGQFVVTSGQTNVTVTNSGHVISGITTKVGDKIDGFLTVWVNNEATTDPAYLGFYLSQNGTQVLVRKLRVWNFGAQYVTIPFTAIITTAGTLGVLLKGTAANADLTVASAFADIDTNGNVRYGQLSIYRP